MRMAPRPQPPVSFLMPRVLLWPPQRCMQWASGLGFSPGVDRQGRLTCHRRSYGVGWNGFDGGAAMIPGEIFPAPGEIILNMDRADIALTVANTGDRPIQVGSHYHFAESN